MGRLGKMILMLAFIGYPIVLHAFILKEEVDVSQLLLVFAPLLAVASWVVFRMFGKAWWPLLALVFAAAVYYVVTGNHERIGLLAVNGLSHAVLNLFLLWLFGRTLLRGREPLVFQISRHINGELEPEIVVYTRQVTIAWCIYFALQVIISLLLYVFATLAAWSFFINVLNLPLLMLMFVAEKAYRTARFPDHPRTSIMKVIEVYSKDFAVPRKADSER
ncbi:hypothetical protein [Sideroxydans lithotrophicus]|uniref:Transmembrane protein n=1 Tax=Sideroxydans lithotrophicus (strain ES-1) TaxID=580332 RepID=D5CLL7_SIDLE|nr:hypothetical protein [Sideroxydans lithotrophicus]ADE10605.1 conserved hypothetical protein [Sideroxydans lithotrophicus ES-1]